jgi:aminoglycoside phosphotransferase (APT) family kinase protein
MSLPADVGATMLSPDDGPLIASAFGLGDGVVFEGPVARGEVGQVWRLTTRRGTFAVKEPFEPPSLEEANDDAAFQDLVRAAGVPMPALVRTPDGSVVTTIDGHHIRLYEWVDLLAVDRTIDPAAVGEVVARIHRVHYHGATGVDPWYTDPVGAAVWDELIDELVAAGAHFAERLAAQRDELVALERCIEPPTVLQTCHRDLFADNVLATLSGGLCVIDWENSGLADPSQELALVLFDFAGTDAPRAQELIAAYRAAGGPGVVDTPQSFSMVIAQLGHIGEVSCRRWLDPARAAERDRNEGRVDEFLTEGLTLEMIDRILDAIT